jgi:hypothetical protein
MVALAGRLWDEAPTQSDTSAYGTPLSLQIDVSTAMGASPAAPGPERWVIDADDAELFLGDELSARIECRRGRMTARVSARLVEEEPRLVTRLLLETPAGALLARRGYAVLHAGAVAGPGGAVVIRGAPGAGKSTLVAAAHQAGLRVLGDEAILVSRSDPDDILAAVRDLTLLPEATRLLGLLAGPRVGDPKHRVDLFDSSTPALRRARRVASLVLGDRLPGPARLEPLAPEEFLREFRYGEIPQERWSGTPDHIAAHWSEHGAYRLSGAVDLAGAVEQLMDLVASPVTTSEA